MRSRLLSLLLLSLLLALGHFDSYACRNIYGSAARAVGTFRILRKHTA
jgi:hypothetical protein